MKTVLALAAVLFVGTFTLTHMSVIGTEIIPCDSSLVVYCWTADVLGTGMAWVLWSALFSLGIAWAVVSLTRDATHEP